MQEEKFISEFWKSNERSNFSKEATVLFFYLIYIWKNENKPEKFYVHPASLLCKVRGFTVKMCCQPARNCKSGTTSASRHRKRTGVRGNTACVWNEQDKGKR